MVRSAVREADLAVALINFDAGDMPAGDRGLLSDPDRCGRFRETCQSPSSRRGTSAAAG